MRSPLQLILLLCGLYTIYLLRELTGRSTAMSKQPITIRVSGTHTSYHDAERAQLRIRVSRTHTDQSECYESVSGVTNDLHRWFKDLSPKDQSGEPAPEAAVTWFSMGMLTTSSWVPYAPLDSKGNPRPPPPREYKVSTNFEVKVKDLGKLSELALVLAVRYIACLCSNTYV